MKTVEILDAVKARHNLTSDYAAAALLGLTRSQVSRYRSGKDFMGDDVALRVADLLGADAGHLLASLHAERSRDDKTRTAWLALAERLKAAGLSAVAVAALLGFSGGPDGGAHARTPDPSPRVCALC